jgi:hypothetical protein
MDFGGFLNFYFYTFMTFIFYLLCLKKEKKGLFLFCSSVHLHCIFCTAVGVAA